MKTTRDWQTLALATIATILVAVSLKLSFAAQGEGAKYGSRDPRTCADKTLPKTGAPSSAQAAQYVICGDEHIIDGLILDEDVKVQVGKGRPYNPKEDYNVHDIDVNALVYPIRGSLKQYNCAEIAPDGSNRNRNCSINNEPNAKGLCYRDSFRDWNCKMVDGMTGEITHQQPPPQGAVKTADNKTAPKNQPKTTTPKTESKTDDAVKIDENGFPKLDFSALEKWFDVVRYEYQPTEQKLYLYLKPKTETRETQFFVEFLDKDGILLQTRQMGEFSDIPGPYDAKVGDTVKAHTTIPRENILKQAVSAKIVRRQ